MSKVIRTQDSNFSEIPFASAWPVTVLNWDAPGIDGGLALHVVDAPSEGDELGTFLLLHGEPSWSHLYEEWIPRLTAAGYRCIAPDLPGFGRSEKPTDQSWYSYERHCDAIRYVIESLGLSSIYLVVQDWAGPIGLRQAVDAPDSYSQIYIFNTWLHHSEFEYSDGVKWWHEAAGNPDQLGGDMPTGRIVAGTMQREHNYEIVQATYDAPFNGYDSKAGARAFPAMIPLWAPEVGGAVEQQRCYDALRVWSACPIHFAFGDADPVFPYEQAELWSSKVRGATLDRIEGAGHFVQFDAPQDCLNVIFKYVDSK